MKTPSKLSKSFRQIQLELRALHELGDEIRLQAHLARMDLKDAWRPVKWTVKEELASSFEHFKVSMAGLRDKVLGRIQ